METAFEVRLVLAVDHINFNIFHLFNLEPWIVKRKHYVIIFELLKQIQH